MVRKEKQTMIKTVELNGTEIEVTGLDGVNAHILNTNSTSIYVSKSSGIEPGKDGVMRIYGGTSHSLFDISGTIYIYGESGAAQIYSNSSADNPFT